MLSNKMIGLTALFSSVVVAAPALAAGNLAGQEPIVVEVQLGTSNGEHVFVPNNLTFETGKLYKLVLSNPSAEKHYFTSFGLAHRVYTRKVQMVDAAGTKAEVKGAIREIEVYPGETAEWWFVPVETAELDDLNCHITDQDGNTHAALGMVGTITIK